MTNYSSHEAKTGGVPNRGSLYAVAAAHSKEAIKTLYDLMKNSQNEGIRMGAAKVLLNKVLPDLKQSDGFDYMPEETHVFSPELQEAVNRLTKKALESPEPKA